MDIFKIYVYMKIAGMIVSMFMIWILIGIKICESVGIIDDIICDSYKFKLWHLLVLPSIITAKIFDKIY